MVTGLNSGDVFANDYRVVRLIQAGAMGVVYEVEQLSTGAPRALKLLAAELVGDPAIRQRFELEARIGSQIESDHIVEVVAAGVEPSNNHPYLVMELLRGEELEEICDRFGPLPLGDVGEVVRQLSHGLAAAHELGVVHRDLKPENLFVCASRRADVAFTLKILDFGIAKLVTSVGQGRTQALGTPLYMAPEQAEADSRVSPASDVWAMGLIVFRCLVGCEYWVNRRGSLSALLKEVLYSDLAKATERARDLGFEAVLPSGFDAWFSRCVHRDMGQRFVNADDAGMAFLQLVPPSAPIEVLAKTTARWSRSSINSLAPGEATLPAEALASGHPAAGTFLSGSRSVGIGAKVRNLGRLKLAGAAAVVAGLGGSWLGLKWRSSPQSSASAIRSETQTVERGNEPSPQRPSQPSAASRGSVLAPPAAVVDTPCPDGMVWLGGGQMFMGERAAAGDSSPAHPVELSGYCIDRLEVTAGAYDACVAAGVCLRAPDDVSFPQMTQKQRDVFRLLCNARQPDRAQHPINCVDWDMARRFCSAAGGRLNGGGARLPTEAEWEFAARGSGQLAYPWGDEPPDQTRLNACGTECAVWFEEALGTQVSPLYNTSDGYPATAPVGAFPAGATQQGVFDLAGNVWEWTSDWYAAYTKAAAHDPSGAPHGRQRVVRGGGFNGVDAAWAKPSYRWKTTPETFNHAIGFRCALTPERAE